MTMTRRPRVAAIGLDGSQIASIEPLCGELRAADSLTNYLRHYSMAETDVVVSSAFHGDEVDWRVNLMTVGGTSFSWTNLPPADFDLVQGFVWTKVENTERELAVSPSCPDLYKPLAAELSRQLGQAAQPPAVMRTSWQDKVALIKTTSGHPVALRLVFPTRSSVADGKPSRPIEILLPEGSNLVAWFRAFLCELHESDSTRVPHAPPHLSQPWDWYTPQEMVLADRISQIESEFERLSTERDQLQTKLAAEGERANSGTRRALWADGDDLTAAVQEMLADLGFTVRDMDADVGQDEPKREDLRLTLKDVSGWQAMVEVKGYTSGTRTNDARQIREHRDRYIEEEGRSPDLTVWLSNPYRRREPSSRPAPGQNLKDAAGAVGAVHVLAADLYRQWALVTAGSLEPEIVIQSLVKANPGLWTPPAHS